MHFTNYIPTIKRLWNEGEHEEVEQLLIKCVELTEEESEKHGWGVAPWYYERLAILYRKQ